MLTFSDGYVIMKATGRDDAFDRATLSRRIQAASQLRRMAANALPYFLLPKLTAASVSVIIIITSDRISKSDMIITPSFVRVHQRRGKPSAIFSFLSKPSRAFYFFICNW